MAPVNSSSAASVTKVCLVRPPRHEHAQGLQLGHGRQVLAEGVEGLVGHAEVPLEVDDQHAQVLQVFEGVEEFQNAVVGEVVVGEPQHQLLEVLLAGDGGGKAAEVGVGEAVVAQVERKSVGNGAHRTHQPHELGGDFVGELSVVELDEDREVLVVGRRQFGRPRLQVLEEVHAQVASHCVICLKGPF